jgi:DNA-binding response OmpR family regulator
MVVMTSDALALEAGSAVMAESETQAPPRTVLVADDDPDIRLLIATKLRSAGYDVIAAADGDQAVAYAAHHLPDLVVLDVSMPGMSGIDVCRRIRENPQLSTVPVIMLTARTEATATTLGYLAGADLYLGKPFSPRDVVDHVAGLLATHDARRVAAPAEAAQPADAKEKPAKRGLFGLGRDKSNAVWY